MWSKGILLALMLGLTACGGAVPQIDEVRQAVTLSINEVVCLARSVGVPNDQLATCVAIANAESQFNTDARSTNPPRPGHCPHGSTDRGLWQINDCWHPEVSDTCAFDANCNAEAMFRISGGGRNWSQWTTYGNGRGPYRMYLPAAEMAVANATCP